MNIKEIRNKTIEEVRAYIAANFLGDVREGGCDTCGCGEVEGITMEAISEILDKLKKREPCFNGTTSSNNSANK